MKKNKPIYREVAFKLSGEALGGQGERGYSEDALHFIAGEIREAHDLGVRMAIIVGGGNIARGDELEKMGIDRPDADLMGMLFTTANAVGLKSIFKKHNIPIRVATALHIPQAGELYVTEKVLHSLRDKNQHVIIACGTGNPYFSTDTAVVLRALELRSDVILKGTKVDGVYDKDPSDPSAQLLRRLTPQEMLDRKLEVMDETATTLLISAMKERLPIIVFNFFEKGNLAGVLCGDESIGSHVVYDDK